jgi:hypothetical protein
MGVRASRLLSKVSPPANSTCPFNSTVTVSLPSLRRRLPFLVRLVHRYYGTVRLLQHVHVRRAAYGLRGPAMIVRPRRVGDLPVLVHVVSQRARVLRLRRTDRPLAIRVVAVLPPPTRNEVGILIYGLFAGQSPRPPIPLSPLQETPRDVPCKTRGQDGFATSFPVGLLHPLQHAGLARRSPGSRLSSQNLAFRFRTEPSSNCDTISDLWMSCDSWRISLLGVRVSPVGVRPITLDPPARGAIIR